jgi:hypothetical protein
MEMKLLSAINCTSNVHNNNIIEFSSEASLYDMAAPQTL